MRNFRADRAHFSVITEPTTVTRLDHFHAHPIRPDLDVVMSLHIRAHRLGDTSHDPLKGIAMRPHIIDHPVDMHVIPPVVQGHQSGAILIHPPELIGMRLHVQYPGGTRVTRPVDKGLHPGGTTTHNPGGTTIHRLELIEMRLEVKGHHPGVSRATCLVVNGHHPGGTTIHLLELIVMPLVANSYHPGGMRMTCPVINDHHPGDTRVACPVINGHHPEGITIQPPALIATRHVGPLGTKHPFELIAMLPCYGATHVRSIVGIATHQRHTVLSAGPTPCHLTQLGMAKPPGCCRAR